MVYAPGRDRPPTGTARPTASYSPGSGAGGVFAEFLQGATTKYAQNKGFRSDFFRNTLARLFVRVDASEMNLFLASIGDEHTRSQLAPRLAGDPAPRQNNRVTGGANTDDGLTRSARTPATNGYLDFFISSMNINFQEKMDVKEELSDNYVAYFFGQNAPVWPFTGWLLNTVQDDQASNMFRLYSEILRGTQLARRQKSVDIKIDSYIISGAMCALSLALNAQNETYVPFSFQFLVKKVTIVNYTLGWVPTRASTAFAADPNAIPYDGRPRPEGSLHAIAARIPAGTEEIAPTPPATVDPRTVSSTTPADALMSVPIGPPNITPVTTISGGNASSFIETENQRTAREVFGPSETVNNTPTVLDGEMQALINNPRFNSNL